MNASWYFTAPWDPVSVRRGDPLGFRAGADYFADLLAPGLNNTSSDARWISLLSWSLKWSHVAWQNAGGRDLSSSDNQRARYAWLRPLELLWVDRALESGQTTGQLRGRRSIERWRKAERQLSDFGMSSDQFRRYRQVGTYGAYRVILRTAGLTTGDGWTPADTALKLAALVNESLPNDVQLKREHFESGTKWGHWANDEAQYWVRRGWPAAHMQTSSGMLPTPDDAITEPLPTKERRLLEPVLFSAESTRRATAEALASAKGIKFHSDLCDILANSSALSKKIEPRLLAPLPAFSRFADAALHAMHGLWNNINCDGTEQTPPIARLARSTELQTRLDAVRGAGAAWLSAPERHAFPHDYVVTQLAESMQTTTSTNQLQALARHHHKHGGGKRWFQFHEHSKKIIPLEAYTGIAASDYRFRLRPLCRLSAQCGLANMNSALDAVERNEHTGLKPPETNDEDGYTL